MLTAGLTNFIVKTSQLDSSQTIFVSIPCVAILLI